MIYFDNSATTPVLPKAADEAKRYMTEVYYNPAAAYSPAVKLERDVTEARAVIARAMGCDKSEVYFTSCGTESNNTALFGTLRAVHGTGRVIISAAEHPSVYEAAMELREMGWDVKLAPVLETGEVDLAALPERLTAALPEGIEVTAAYEAERKCAQIKWLRIEGLFEYDERDGASMAGALRAF
ncbi:MAG: aminotransferase class V-fold PLP-dependent enzyme, partial [Clostridia bacterium]|nr:aminotransferase class V-fold PLP-dependent enzyme [Clostridia bacterium]